MEERTAELRREPPPPWYRENWWVFLVVLLLIVGGIIAYFALRDGGGDDRDRLVVPNVLGMSEPEARETLTGRGFEVEAVRRPSGDPPQTVIEQDPGVGERLARGGRVTITVSTGPSETQTETESETETETETETTTATTSAEPGMPRVIATDYREAVEVLLDADLFPDTYPAESPEERGVVVAQRPAPGTPVEPGSGPRLNVSLGEEERSQQEIPDLTGLPLPEAIRQCADTGFTCRTANERGENRRVARQRPAAGRSAPELTQITLTTG